MIGKANSSDGPKNLREFREYRKGDRLFDQVDKPGLGAMRYLFEAGYKYTFWLRATRMFYLKGKAYFPLFAVSRAVYKHKGYKYSFDISYHAQIGKGLQIAHYGYVVVPANTVMGENCRLRPGVIIGTSFTHEGENGTTVGDGVEFGVGSKVIGAGSVGSNVIIGANAVVTKPVPDNCVVAGVPAKVVRVLE